MEDEKIIDLYFRRDERAIDETAKKYGTMIRGICCGILKSYVDGEECENDTYGIAWSKIPPVHPTALSAFLGRIARNVSFDRYRYNKAEKRNCDFCMALSELEDCIVSPIGIDAEIDRRAISDAISAFLHTISSTKRIVFVRRYWYCDSIEKIASDLGFSSSKVKSMLMRTRIALRKYLERNDVDL